MNNQRSFDIRWIVVICLYGLAAFWGVIQVVDLGGGGVRLLLNLAYASCAAIWVIEDARRRGRPILHIVQCLVFLAWPVAVPIYLIVSRQTHGFLLTAAHAAGLFITLYVFFYLTLLIIYGTAVFGVG